MANGLILYYWQLDCKLGALAQFALYRDVAMVQHNNLLDVCQTQTKALYIMSVACMYAIELVEHLLKIVLLKSKTRIANREIQMLVVVPCAQVDVHRLVGLAILYGIVEQVVNYVLEMHLVYVYCRVDSLDLRINLTSSMLDT